MRYSVPGRAGETLFGAMQRAGVPVESPCGGRGICGKCVVSVASADLEEELPVDTARTAPPAKDGAFRELLSCGTRFLRDGQAIVEIGDGSLRIVDDFILPLPEGAPVLERKTVELPEPGLEDTGSELGRLEAALGLRFGDSTRTARALGARAGKGSRSVTLTIQYGEGDSRYAGIDEDVAGGPLAAAVDIGTTTVVARLMDMESEAALGSMAEANVQRWAGADVISRIAASEDRVSFEKMRDGIRAQIGRMLSRLLEAAGREPSALARIVIAGNPTMLHLLAGVNPEGIARAPFVPVFSEGFDMAGPGEICGWPFGETCRVVFIPGVSAYVGADIVAGALACGLCREDPAPSLFLDLGTNGEMMLFSSGKIWCCSAAAGPAFEGASIKFGCPSVPGAIDHVTVSGGGLAASVLGGGAPTGICGSGILDTVACLLWAEAVDETGRICPASRNLDARHFIAYEDQPAILLDEASGIFLTQEDIRQVQLAKAAVAAGVDILLKEAGIRACEIRRVYLAGGFGSRLNPDSAIAIGLFPASFSGKVESVGNASLAGAGIVALRRGALDTCGELARRCVNIELSGRPDFTERFSDAMLFPERSLGPEEASP